MPCRVEDSNGKLIFVTSPKRSGTAYLIAVIVEALIIGKIVSSKDMPRFAQVWIFSCSLLGLAGFIWQLRGREVIIFDEDTVTTRKELPLGQRAIAWKKKVFVLEGMPQPFYVPPKQRGESTDPSGIGFKVDSKTFRCGDHMTSEEVHQLVDIVRNRFPRLATLWNEEIRLHGAM